MPISIKCFATLDKFQPENPDSFPINPGESVIDLMDRLEIPKKEVHIIFVNGVGAKPETLLKEGDRVGLFPAVGGG